MKKTQHYGLCQWDAEDRILREDFNSDNAKLDETLAGLSPVVKLLDVTTEADAKEVDLDLTGIQWELYREVQVWCRITTTTTSSSDGVSIRLNKSSDYRDSLGNSTPDLAGFAVAAGGTSAGKLILYGAQQIAGFMQGISSQNNRLFDTSASSILAPEACQTLNFIMSTGKIKTGSELMVYGVRK